MKKLIIICLFLVFIISGCQKEPIDHSCNVDADCTCTCECGCFNVNSKCDTCEGFGPWKECIQIYCVAGPGYPVCINNTCQPKHR